jgi:hypothetical protein
MTSTCTASLFSGTTSGTQIVPLPGKAPWQLERHRDWHCQAEPASASASGATVTSPRRTPGPMVHGLFLSLRHSTAERDCDTAVMVRALLHIYYAAAPEPP